jgi:hypothetical protein
VGEARVELTTEDRVLDLIERVGYRVVVLHGPHERDGLSGRDVDCMVDGLDPKWPLRLPEGWRLCQWFRYDFKAWYWALEHDAEFVAVDTTDDPEGLCRDAVRTGSLTTGSEGEPSPFLHAAYLTVKRVRKRMLEPAEWAAIGKVASRDPSRFAAELDVVAGSSMSTLLAPGAIGGIPPTLEVLRRADRLRWSRRFGSPVRVVHALSIGARRYFERIGSPAGLSILLVGPDGAGKSAVAERLPTACAAMFRRASRSHWRPGILPRPGAIVGRTASDPTQPHRRRAFGRVPSALLVGYYWFDFLAGALLRDAPMKVRSGLIVRERGWWDLAVDPRRYRLRIAPGAVRALGRLLPAPDLVILLRSDASVLHARKPELEPPELERQLVAWDSALPVAVPVVRIDVSRPLEEVLGEAVEAVTRLMESRAVSRLDSGWAALPVRQTRWWLPRGPRTVASASVSVYQPVSRRALVGWSVARAVGARGGFRFLPRGTAPPHGVRRALAPHVPPRGTFAVARATHRGRFIALLLDERGECRAVAKLATDPAGVEALNAEATALRRVEGTLPRPLASPRVLRSEAGLLLMEPFRWTPRRRPWELEEEVARGLGEFFRAGKRVAPDGSLGPAHGDCAPWNLLRTPDGWALVDWESAGDAPAFNDVCHYIVQSHALLGSPSASEVVEGFASGRGPVGRAVRAYAEGADIPVGSARACLVRYLRQAVPEPIAMTAAERRGVDRRRRLLARMER